MQNKNKPKIGIFTRPMDQKTSGSGSHLRQILEAILSQNKEYDITLIHYEKNDIAIYNKTNELIIPRNPLLASIILRSKKFDIIQYAPLTIYSPIWFIKSKKIAIIHGLEIDLMPQLYTKIKVLHQKYIHPWYARKMDYIFTVSETSKKYLAIKHKINPNRIVITYNSVNDNFKVLDDKEKIRNDVFHKYGINSKFILHISKYSKRKNPYLIIDAFKSVHENKKELMLVIVGKDWENQEIVNYIKRNNLTDHVLFTGFAPTEDIIQLLNMAEVFIFPSFAEGFGMPNIEAMACGCPVITSKAFAIPEIVGDAAIILEQNENNNELSDSILQIMNDPILRKALVQKGLERIKRYSWKISAENALNTYEKMIK